MYIRLPARLPARPQVVPGQNIWTSVDKLLTHDVCGPGTFGIFQKEFGEEAQVRGGGRGAGRGAGAGEESGMNVQVQGAGAGGGGPVLPGAGGGGAHRGGVGWAFN